LDWNRFGNENAFRAVVDDDEYVDVAGRVENASACCCRQRQQRVAARVIDKCIVIGKVLLFLGNELW
jgi:hypothetical protein